MLFGRARSDALYDAIAAAVSFRDSWIIPRLYCDAPSTFGDAQGDRECGGAHVVLGLIRGRPELAEQRGVVGRDLEARVERGDRVRMLARGLELATLREQRVVLLLIRRRERRLGGGRRIAQREGGDRQRGYGEDGDAHHIIIVEDARTLKRHDRGSTLV